MPAITAPRYGVLYGWEAGEDFWGGPMNQNLVLLDALLNPYIISMTFSSPPQNSEDGDMYLIASGASGDWAGHDGHLAYRISGTWAFFSPTRGVRARLASSAAFIWYNGSAWLDEYTGQTPGTTDPSVTPIYYDIGVTVPYAIEANEYILYQPILQPLMLPVNGAGSAFRMAAGAPGTMSLILYRNSTQIGTMTISSGQSAGVFSVASPTALGAGDILNIRAPSVVVAGFQNFGIGVRLLIVGS